MGLSTAFSLGRTNPSPREFILPFRESLISLENRLCCSIPYCIPSTEFLPDGGFVQTAYHSFFNLSTQTIQYLGVHTILGESFLTFLDSINALRPKLVVLIKATGEKGSSLIATTFFLLGDLSIPLLILSCMTFLKPQHVLVVWFRGEKRASSAHLSLASLRHEPKWVGPFRPTFIRVYVLSTQPYTGHSSNWAKSC